jgi:hypothetical protein
LDNLNSGYDNKKRFIEPICNHLTQTERMKKIILAILFLLPIFAFGQDDTLHINSAKPWKSYLSQVLIGKKSNLGVFDIHYSKGRLSRSFYCVIDFDKKEIVSTFTIKNWTYLYNSWIDNESILHLSRGWLFARGLMIDLKNGSRLGSDSIKEKDAPANTDAVHIDSQDLYCTSSIVYWSGLRIVYDDDLKCFILTSTN